MAMNFWEAQRRAKSRTGLYLALFVFLTLVVAVLSEMAMRYYAAANYRPGFPLIAVIYLGITFAVAGFQYMMFTAYGGSYVAKSVGGEQIDPATDNPQERQLLNIVEEIAIASSLPVPPVYIIPADQINAFAAGMNPHNAAIAITEGTFQRLNRDELQGVIAHEFGHIYNGDMQISMRLAAMVMGFFCVLWIGLRVLQFSNVGGRGRRDEKNGGGNPVLIAGLILIVAGAFTWLFGSILKASVSREREYLADACAVQFTRNPSGIAKALRKIAEDSVADMPKDGIAISHMYFDNYGGLNALFATHPSLEKRIAAIEGRTYIPEEWNIPAGKKRRNKL